MCTEENVELEKARQEWEVLENVQPGQTFHPFHNKTFHNFVFLCNLECVFFFFYPPGLTEDLNPTLIISFNEALQYFQTTDLGDLLVRNAAYQKFPNKSWYFNHKQPLNNSWGGGGK